ncbi:hypothetical protein D1133_05330 [Turicibacter sp. TS3]|jgi:hypothetical protein|nr:hypothetical protein [Turicibacter sp. TS3]
MSIRTVNKKNDGDKMEMVNKVESLIFKQALNYPLIQLIKNKTVIVNDHCTVENFTETSCILKTPENKYIISGENLRIKEYGDLVIRIESDRIKKIEIVGDRNE